MMNRCFLLTLPLLLGAAACGGTEPPSTRYQSEPTDTSDDGDGFAAEVDDADAPSPVADAGKRLDAGVSSSRGDAGVSQRADAGADDADDGGVDASTPSTPRDPGAAFPRSGEPSVAVKGPYTFKTYTQGLQNRAYASSIMYYPEDADPPFAAIVFSPGFTATKESYTKLGEIFASHGFAMLLTTPTSTGDFPDARGADLQAAFAQIGIENTREGSPLKGKLLPDRVCVTGHSMGGGGTLHGATSLGSKIRCAVPLQPWQPGQSFSRIVAPTLFIAAQSDTIAGNAQNSSTHYASIPSSVEKVFAEFRGADHFFTTNRSIKWEDQAAMMVAFYKMKLEDDERYAPYVYGDKRPMSALSRFESSKK